MYKAYKCKYKYKAKGKLIKNEKKVVVKFVYTTGAIKGKTQTKEVEYYNLM